MTLCAMTTTTIAEQIGRGKAKTFEETENETLGQIVQDVKLDSNQNVNIPGYNTKTTVDEDGNTIVAGEADASYQPVLPFSEYQKQRKVELETQYGSDGTNLNLEIDSIFPAGGPTTGETRVTVRGGPFEEMDLLYPTPMCKFGANDRIVKATYVKCSQKALKISDVEGKNKQKVSEDLLAGISYTNHRVYYRTSGVCNVITVLQCPRQWQCH